MYKQSKQHRRYLMVQILKTLGLHWGIQLISFGYQLRFSAGGYAIAVNQGYCLNKAVRHLQLEHPTLTIRESAKAIIFHHKFGN